MSGSGRDILLAYSRIRDLHDPSMSHTHKDIPVPHNQGSKTHQLLSMHSRRTYMTSTSLNSTRISVLTSLYSSRKISNLLNRVPVPKQRPSKRHAKFKIPARFIIHTYYVPPSLAQIQTIKSHPVKQAAVSSQC